MPTRPALPCRNATCPNMQPCPKHPPRKAWAPSRPRHPLGYGRNGWERQRIKAAVLDRDGHRCQLRLPGCTGVATTADHIVSPLDGGLYEPGNLRASCTSCNEARRRQQAIDGRRLRR